MDKYGDEQVKIWRRSYSVRPPEGESLEMTANRAIPYFEKHILPSLKQGKNIFISAHGNSLRAIVKFIENMSDDEILQFEIATGAPIVYTMEEGIFKKDPMFSAIR
jgi:2,3-bisphosphoglycerate-dependent phosphoglycerate mutase